MRKSGCVVLCCVAAALLSVSCNWKSDGEARLKTLFPVQKVVPEDLYIPDVHLQDVDEEGLGGRWVMEMRLPGSMDLPLFGQSALLLVNHFVADIEPGGTKVSLTFCKQTALLDAAGMGDSEMPPETAAAIGLTPVLLALEGEAGIAAQKTAWTWGLKEMENPLTDAIPTTVPDPLVWDQDSDGHDGVTLHVLEPKGERYMVRRAVWDMTAAPLSEDGNWMEGTLAYTVDEAAVGYDGPSQLGTIVPVVPSPEGGTYRLRRVGAAGSTDYDCAKLEEEHLAVFGKWPWPPGDEGAR